MSNPADKIHARLMQDIELTQKQIQELFEEVDFKKISVPQMRKLLKRLEDAKQVIDSGGW